VSYTTVGIIDYGMGNHASVMHSLHALGFRVRVSSKIEILNDVDVLILPGVGAFPSAMQALNKLDLVGYLQKQAQERRPIIGICLGMQLLAGASYEYKYTTGLDLIPGEIVPLASSKSHIGWNTMECVQQDQQLQLSDGQSFYFNHSYRYQGPDEYQICESRYIDPFPSVIRRGNIVGIQFHPEKSQTAGRLLLGNLIAGMVNA